MPAHAVFARSIAIVSLMLVASPSALFAHNEPDAKKHEQPNAERKADEPRQSSEAADVDDHEPRTFEIGINVQRVAKIDLLLGTFDVDFLVSIKCEREPCDPNLVLKNGDMQGEPEQVTDERLHKVIRIKAEMTCNVDLGDFPFDGHDLPIMIGQKGATDVTFVADPEESPAPTDVQVAGWNVLDGADEVHAEQLNDRKSASYYTSTLRVSRPALSAVAKNFLPPIIMLLIFMVTLVLRPKLAAQRLMAGTGTFLSLVMFHNAAAKEVPPLGFFTVLDKFMFVMYSVGLLHVITSVVLIRADDDNRENFATRAHGFALFGLPIVALLGAALVLLRVI